MKNLKPLLFLALFIAGCSTCKKKNNVFENAGAIVLDYGKRPLEVEPIYAKNFSLSGEGMYKVLKTWNIWKGSSDTMTYILYPRGMNKPAGFEGATFIETPIRRAVCLSTTQVAMLGFLEQEKCIVGASNLGFICNEKVRAQADSGYTHEVGDGNTLNYEHIASLQPDVVFAFAMGDAGDVMPTLNRLHIPVVLTAEYTEETPLGRAEWVRFVGAFFDNDSLALKRYLAVASEYESLLKMTASKEDRPTVLAGVPDRGRWYVPGGKSFVAQYIQDAGGTYLWKSSEESGSIPLTFEAVFAKAQEADIWVDLVFTKSLDDLAKIDRRLKDFKAFQNEDAFNYDLRRSPGGGYDIFESGVVNPHIVLKDFIKMLSAEEFPDHQFYYYRRLEKEVVN